MAQEQVRVTRELYAISTTIKKNDTVAFIKLRCERWLEGERMELWLDGPGASQDHQRAIRNINNDKKIEKQQQRCIELAADGQFSKATKALVSSGPLKRNPDLEKAMKEKHPPAQREPDLSDLATPGRAQVPEFDNALIKKIIKSFPRGSAPGPSGLRAQHLKDAVRSAHGDEALEQLTSICNLLARGEALSFSLST